MTLDVSPNLHGYTHQQNSYTVTAVLKKSKQAKNKLTNTHQKINYRNVPLLITFDKKV